MQSRITMLFEYIRPEQQGETLIARGEQQIACMNKTDSGMLPAKIPLSLRSALDLYRGDRHDVLLRNSPQTTSVNKS